MKKCKDCKNIFPLEMFGVNKAYKDGLQVRCLICKRIKENKYYLENKFSFRERRLTNKISSREKKNELNRKYKQILVNERGGGCERCGYSRYIGALTFHHRDPSTKEFNLSANVSLARKRIEAEKCDLLCFNCHEEVEHGYIE